jgi:lipoic acid synthetase
MGRLKRNIPDWIKFKIPAGKTYSKVKKTIAERGLHTICTEARCPNIGECFGIGTATFLILGNICTRNCRYCSVSKGVPLPPDEDEPHSIAEAVTALELRYAVITSVTRDDLPDGGSSLFTATVDAIRRVQRGCRIELLIPDFKNDMESSIARIVQHRPDVINHNIEVVRRFYRELRPMGDYDLSLRLLELISSSGIPVKSGLMIGFGEDLNDIEETLRDLHRAGCTLLTVGQYLKPNREGYPVKRYYHPDEFREIEKMAGDIGFAGVQAGPLVRSSYHAATMV